MKTMRSWANPDQAHDSAFVTFDEISDALDPWETPSLTYDGIDLDDGLEVIFEDNISEPMRAVIQGMSGEEVSQQWDSCKVSKYQHFLKNYGKHSEDVVASELHNFMYVDNVKAGSSTIRFLLEKVLHRTWFTSGFGDKRKGTGRYERFSTADFPEQSQLFKFSMVRDPVAKFESGVRQAWIHYSHKYDNMSADEILDEILQNHEKWISDRKNNRNSAFDFGNEHLQPSSYRLFTFDGSSHPSLIHVDYIGQLEHFERHWATIVGSFSNVNEKANSHLLRHVRVNDRPRTDKSKLSEAGVKRLCASELYKFEWSCFSYPLPDVCQ